MVALQPSRCRKAPPATPSNGTGGRRVRGVGQGHGLGAGIDTYGVSPVPKLLPGVSFEKSSSQTGSANDDGKETPHTTARRQRAVVQAETPDQGAA